MIDNLRLYFQINGIDKKFCINEFISYFRNKGSSTYLSSSRLSSARKEKKKEALNIIDVNITQDLVNPNEELEDDNTLDLKREIIDMIYYINDQLFPQKANL